MNQKVSIIILNWNKWKDIIECLESLYQINYPNYDVIVVDNGSQDESVEMIKNYASGELSVQSDFFEYKKNNKPINIFEYSAKELESLLVINENFNNLDSNNKLILIKNEVNSGFSDGNNLGINFSLQFLNSSYILLLNNDTVVDKNFLNELVKFADTDRKVGIVGPMVNYYDNPNKTAYIGHNVNLCNGRISDPFKIDLNSPKYVQIDYVVGCGLLIKRCVVDDIGLLDPNYFLYYEDVDWCLRARKQGYKIFYVSKSKIWHKIPSEEIRSLSSYYYGNRNSFLLIKKNSDSFKLFCYIQLIINKLIFALYLMVMGKINASNMVMQAVYDAFRDNYGYKKLE
jgi:GT2 family glycosyltransferase